MEEIKRNPLWGIGKVEICRRHFLLIENPYGVSIREILRRSFLLIIFTLSIVNNVHGQRIRGFISSGFTLSQIEGDELKSFRKWGYSGGVGAMVTLSKDNIWKFSVEALFTQRGSYNGTGDPYSISLRLDYVDIPVMLHYHDPWGGMLIGVGLDYSRLVQQPHNIMKYNPLYFIPDTTDMTFLSNDLMVVADFRFPIWKSLWFNFRWTYSLIAIKKDWQFSQADGEEPILGPDGNPVLNPDGTPQMTTRWKRWTNDCYNHSLVFRLIWQF